MGHTPEAFMIYKEELKKAEVEKKRLKEEYDRRLTELKAELLVLKERIGAQEDVLRRVTEYATQLESELEHFHTKVNTDVLRNSNGFH